MSGQNPPEKLRALLHLSSRTQVQLLGDSYQLLLALEENHYQSALPGAADRSVCHRQEGAVVEEKHPQEEDVHK